MTTVAILPVQTKDGMCYQGIAGDKHSEGSTPGEALDALSQQLSEEQESDAGMLVVVQRFRPDRFFNAAQQQRLKELMAAWRTAREEGRSLPPDTQAELEALVDTELQASAQRAKDWADETPTSTRATYRKRA